MKILTAALAVLAVTAAADAQRAPYGLPLQPGEDCAVRWYERDGSGELVAKTRTEHSGSYSIRIREGRETLIEADGTFSPHPWGETLLLRTILTARHEDSSRRDGRWSAGQDGLNVDLRVYNDRGQMICRDQSLDVREFTSLFSSYQQPRRNRVDTSILERRW